MTSKVQTLATVAVLAALTMSFGMTSAFAAVASEDINVAASGTTSSSMDVVSCGTGDCAAMIQGSASQDYAKIWYGMWGSNNTCDTTSYTSGLGAVKTENWGTISGWHSHQYNETVDAGDHITIVNVYTSCT